MQFDFQAYFFDYDGVIANTMDYNFMAWEHAFKEIGTSIDKKIYFLQEGKTRKIVAHEQLERAGIETELAQQVALRKDQIFKELFANKVSLYPNILNMLQLLKKKNKILIMVTGASRERIEKSTINREILPFFDNIVTANDTKKGKPNPDPYLKALEYSNLSTKKCVVIENAPAGIEAAKKVGLTCIAICHTLAANQLEKADFILNNSTELYQTILTHFKEDAYAIT